MKPLISNFVPSILLIFLSALASHALADDVQVAIKVHVQLDKLHPDVDKVWLKCISYDKQGHSINVQAGTGTCNGNSIVDVGNDRKVNGNMTDCSLFDETKALKASWDKYRCEIWVHNGASDNWEAASSTSSKNWAKVKTGSVVVSEGQFQ